MAPHVNDAVVAAIIKQSLAGDRARQAKPIVERVWQAFVALQARRRQVEPFNIDLAAAEHYMYARYLAGASGDPTVKLAPTLYGLKSACTSLSVSNNAWRRRTCRCCPPATRSSAGGRKARLRDWPTTPR
jgi:hypothetical protein